MRTTIQQAIAGAAIGMCAAMVIGFIKSLIGEKLFYGGSLVPLPTGVTAAILFAIFMGIYGGVIGLIVGALGLRPYYGALIGLLLVALRWAVVYDALRTLAKRILSDHVNLSLIAKDIFELSTFVDFAIVGALVSIGVRRLFAK